LKTTTKCVHSGTYVDPATRGINTPIFTSSSSQYIGTEVRLYPRYFNVPNQRAVVEKLADLEGCEDGILFSSGMAAISSVMMSFLKPGDHAVIQDDIYGGAHTLMTDMLSDKGINLAFAGPSAQSIIDCCTSATKVVYLESPTNPMLRIIDIAKVGAFCRSKGILSVIDNTFASPINQNPATLGIDIIIHSGTKYLGGHSDLCCGVALGSKDMVRMVRKTALSLGGSLNAQSCYLLERSLKTLSLRVQRQTDNAGMLASFLAGHHHVSSVCYPGLPDAPGHEIAKSQMSGFGAMLAFETDPKTGTAHEFMGRLALIKPAMSLGGIESTICDPASTSHRNVATEVRNRQGISDRLMRMSVGIEDAEDLIADLAQALG
jgi:cystathionine beta-lyase/cystathionine gamma-synthase